MQRGMPCISYSQPSGIKEGAVIMKYLRDQDTGDMANAAAPHGTLTRVNIEKIKKEQSRVDKEHRAEIIWSKRGNSSRENTV